MVRGPYGFVILEDDKLIENALAFLIGTRANQTGTAGELPWDHRFGTPVESLRHANVRRGLLEWFVSVMAQRVGSYFSGVARLTAVERYYEMTSLRLRAYWRNVRSEEEKAIDVEFESA